ncbi:DOPA-like domain-containing protein [Aspergillus heterothallicus]
MTDQFSYTFPSPLEGYEGSEPLSDERNDDGKSMKNPQHGVLSQAYEVFPDPLSKDRRGGFDIHIYHFQNNPDQVTFAKALWERIRREFPELRIYSFFDKPVGPHPVAMFEVNLFTPAQFGAFVPWLVINRGPLSALIHPNTAEGAGEEERNHTQRATWLGERIPLDLRIFKLMKEKEKLEEAEAEREAAAKRNGDGET